MTEHIVDRRGKLNVERLASVALLTVGAMLVIITAVAFVARLIAPSGWPIGIRSTAFSESSVMEIGDASWYTAIIGLSLVLVWAGLRSLQTRIPIPGCLAAALVAILVINTNVSHIVSPVMVVSVTILIYIDFVKPRLVLRPCGAGGP